jgi:MarR family
MKVVAQRLRCTASSLTFISDRLVERGYINRAEDPANRRFRVLSLTRSGRAARQAALDILNEACPLVRLSDDEREALLSLLGQTLIEPGPAAGAPARPRDLAVAPAGSRNGHRAAVSRPSAVLRAGLEKAVGPVRRPRRRHRHAVPAM